MSGNEQVEVKTSPLFEETITLKQNGFSNGKVITYIDELKLKLTKDWQKRAKQQIVRVHNINLDLQRSADKTIDEGVKELESNNRASRSP